MNKQIGEKDRAAYSCITIVLIMCLCVLTACAAPAPKECDRADTSELEGTVQGSWEGKENVEGGHVNGVFEARISADGTVTGTYSGFLSGTISGCVDSSGQYTAGGGGSGPAVSWSGVFRKSKDGVIGEGTWTAASVAKGTWSGRGL